MTEQQRGIERHEGGQIMAELGWTIVLFILFSTSVSQKMNIAVLSHYNKFNRNNIADQGKKNELSSTRQYGIETCMQQPR